MKRIKGLLSAIGLLVATGAASVVMAADRTRIMEIAADAFFHVDVAGQPRLKDHPLHAAQRSGKAFAVSPNLLVTARHVLGARDEWRLATIDNPILARAVQPLDRTITALSTADPQPVTDAVVVSPSSATLNAAGLRLTSRQLPAHFTLSFCPIDDRQDYWALMTTHPEPGTAQSIETPELVQLDPVGPGQGTLGGLYAFQPARDVAPVLAEWGHDGSPIFDAENNVVAIVSAVADMDGATTILATPIQPMIPGTLRQLAQEPDPMPAKRVQRRCSMADTVKRIHDQLNAHSIWNVSIDRFYDQAEGKMVPSGDIIVEYENVAEAPNIKEIVVAYDVNGKVANDREYGRISEPPDVTRSPEFLVDPLEVRVTPQNGQRRFVIGDFRKLIEPYETSVRERNRSGYIQEIVLFIYPIFEGKSEPEERPVKRRILFVELR